MPRPSLLLAAIVVGAILAVDVPPATPKAPKPASRPALRRGGVLSQDANADAQPDEVVEVEIEADAEDADAGASADAPPAVVEESGGGLGGVVQQLALLAIVVFVRMGLAFFKSHFKDRPSPFAGVAASMTTIPMLGDALRLVQTLQAKFAEMARSPQSAPIMMALLILATKLVQRADARHDAQVEAAEAAAAAEREGGDAVVEEVSAADEEDEDEAAEVEAEDEVDEIEEAKDEAEEDEEDEE